MYSPLRRINRQSEVHEHGMSFQMAFYNHIHLFIHPLAIVRSVGRCFVGSLRSCDLWISCFIRNDAVHICLLNDNININNNNRNHNKFFGMQYIFVTVCIFRIIHCWSYHYK